MSGVDKYRTYVLSLFLVCLALIIWTCNARLSGNERDRQALLAFRAKITHDPQGALGSWNSSLFFCNWEGILCSKVKQRVTSINLSSKGLGGSMSPYIGNMSFLSEIILYNNNLQGTIPQEVGRLFRLKVLSLGRNALEGSIPDTLGLLDRLVSLELFSNKLSGMIPPIFNLSLLNVFNLANNLLQGSIPSDFGFALPNLQKIQLSNNKFTGNIPISLSNASRLQVIDLQFNNFSGPVSIDFGRLLHLQNLVLESNNLGLGGQSDLSFLNSLINCSSLKILKLGGNNFRGSLPHSVANLSNELTMISLADNRISGSIPLEIGKFINLIFLSLEGNRFTGIIPPEIAKLRKLQRVLLSNNRLSGNIPASIGNLSMLDEVHLENNELNGTIPPSFGHCPMLVLLELSQNNLSGSIPSKLFDISPFSLKLNLSQNRLVGSLPAGVGALKTLVELDISENQLSGLIPTQLADCIALNSLNMQGNFIQGNISQSMKKLRGLQYLDLSRNKLSGKIPDFLETLSLKYLNLSRNNLEGEVLKQGVFANASAFSIVGNKGLCGGIPELQLPRCSSHGSHKHKMSWVQVLIVISSIPVLAIGYYIWLRRRKEKPPSFLGSKTYTSPIKLSYKLLHEATEEFSPNNLVSEGNSGLVYKGKISSPPDNETFIAVKVFKPQASNQFITECEALRNIRHRNIIKIKSTCTGFTDINKKFTAIVYDFMEHKSLDRWKHLTSTSSHNEHCMPQILNLGTRINIAIDVANALDYIHNQVDNPLIHCNLKLSNILLDTDMSAHVSNFGMAKFLTDLGSTSQSNFNGFAGTLEYAPPEYYQGSMVSTKGDVYSYGIILLEMLTGKKITDPMFHGSFTLQNFVSNALSERVYDIIDLFILHELNRYDPARAKDCLKMLLDIGVRCAQEFPQFRPDIRDVLSVLETINNIFKASRVDTEAYPQGSFQAAFFMAQRFKRSLLRNRIEVPFQSPGVENFNRADWTIDRAGQSINPFPEIISDSVTVSYMDLHKATNGFSSTNLVGAGGFGSVYKGMFRQKKFHHLIRHGNIEAGTEAAVAIKVFNLQRRGAVRSFNTEYQTLKKLNHEYIVKIITTCTSVDHEGRDFRAILFEFMDHGSLQTWLHPTDNINDDGPNPPRTLSLLARINIAIDVACALDYLHRQCTNCIIHCDLKPGNILIDKDMFARIADFGLAISLPESANMTQCSSATGMRGTTGYIAPGLKIKSGKKSGSKASGQNKNKGKRLRIICRTRHEGQLDTKNFDEYMRLILKIIPEERKTGCSFFDPMFFISYMDAVKKAKKKDCTAIEKSNVWKWIKKQKIFACRYVFVPICQSNHWNLLILCNLGEDLEMNEKSPCMLLLDSLQEAEPKNLEPCIKQFVYQMYKNESVQGTDDVFQFDLSIPMVPQQDDGEKCGYYVLYYMFKFLMSCPENFNINEHGGFMNSSWFTEEEMNNFFNNLSSEKLHTDQMQASEDIIVVKEKNLSSNMEVDGQNVDNEIAAEEIDKLSKDEEEAEMVVQCEPIRSLVVYTPESSQEQQEPNQPTPPASETIATHEKDGKEKLAAAAPSVRKSPRLQPIKEDEEDFSIHIVDPEGGENAEKGPAEKAQRKVRATKNEGVNKRKAVEEVQHNKEKKLKKKVEAENEDEEVEEEEEKDDDEKPKKILIRAYPSTFSKTISRLSEAQRQWVKSAGFGALLHFTLGEELPHKTIVNCLWWFEHNKCEFGLFPNRNLKITEDDVFDIIGLPQGKLDVKLEDSKDKIQSWGKQFKERQPSRITEKMLREKIAESRDADEHFKQNFMILMANLFIRTDKTSFVCPKILRFSGNFDNARDYNWCKLVIQNLKEAHEQWWNDPKTQYYTGCFVFLLYFYLARTSHPDVRVKKTWPAFVGWKNSCIDDRAKREGLDNNFGYGDIVPEFETPDESNQNHVNSELYKGGNSNFTTPKETLKGVGPSRLFSPQDNVDASILSIARDVEQNHNSTEVLTEDEISSRLQHHLSQMEKLKKEFGETLDKGKQLFPESDKMKEYEQRFEEMTTGSIDKGWDFFTYKDWKTFDILMLPENERAFNKMHDIDDFLDDLKLGGQVVDSNIYTKHITRNEPSYAAYGLNNHLKRVLKPTDHQKSPFKIRVIDLNTQRFSKDEEEVWSWINGRKNRAMIEIFLWNNVTCLKHHIQSLQIGKEVLFHVVDAYTSILNEDEKFRAAESPYRFFCSTMVTMGNVVKGSQLVANSTDPNITYMKFKSNMDAILFKHGVDINHVDLIFFPIFSGNHFYLICFNLRKICVDIIDNRSGDRVDIMYDGIPEALQENFGLYMAQKSPRKIKFLNNAPVERLEMKWRTSNKNVDSGVFVMHHMETYMGYTLRNWDCKFAAEGIEQKRQLEKARKIYAAKIVYSEINILKDHMKTEIKFVNQN